MIAVIDYGMGNLGSIANMLRKIGAPAVVTAQRESIERADGLILPGVGSFDAGMRSLSQTGLVPLLRDLVVERKRPILGICLGLQLLTRNSEEGEHSGLGWLDAETVRFRVGPADGLRIPHMGWRHIRLLRSSPLLTGFAETPRFYFVHSYHLACRNAGDVLATAEYGYHFAAAVATGNIMGTQFHPEKSHRWGMRLLRNFVELIQ